MTSPATLRRRRPACGHGGLPRRPAAPPDRHQPAERLPGARRRHRHQHGPHPRGRGQPSSSGGRPAAGLAEVCKAIGHGSLMGARGNSGVILSQLLRGMSERMARPAPAASGPTLLVDAWPTPPSWPARPWCARSRARSSPWPRAAADGAPGRAGVGHLVGVARARPRRRPPTPSARTPRACSRCWPRPAWSTPAARGSCSCSTPSCSSLDGRPLPEPSGVAAPDLAALNGQRSATPRTATGDGGDGEPDVVGDLRYEVMYLLARARRLHRGLQGGVGRHRRLHRRRRAATGCGTATSTPTTSARPSRPAWTPAGPADPGHRPRRAGRGGALGARERRRARRRTERRGRRPAARRPSVVAVVSGDGIGRIFRSLGVHHLVVGGQTMNPSTADLRQGGRGGRAPTRS